MRLQFVVPVVSTGTVLKIYDEQTVTQETACYT
jgi:hypothetical protein